MSDGKTLDVTSAVDLQQKVSDVKVFGNPDAWQLLCKASSESQGWMKSTKVMEAANAGVFLQVTTQQKNPDGSWAIAESVTFAPDVIITRNALGELVLRLA